MSDTLQNILEKVIALAQQDYESACQLLDSEIANLPSAQLNNLGLGFYQKIEYELCKRVFDHLLANEPNNHSAHNNIGLALNRLGLGKKATKHYQKAINIKPDYHQARSNLAYTSLYFGKTGRSEILSAHKDIATFVFNKGKNYLNNQKRPIDESRRLNVAYLSSDFRNHAVGRFIYGILDKHDLEKFTIHILDNRAGNSDLSKNDQTTTALKNIGHPWHDISSKNTDDVCQLIVRNNIDILIDLSGHTQGGRPDVMSNRVAPIQINYLGYPATSGMPTIDYRIGDKFADLKKFQAQNTETMLRLSHAMWNYTPWPDMPQFPTQLPYETNHSITFGSANNHAKIQTSWLELWVNVLHSVPNSRFRIKSRGLKSPTAQRQLTEFFNQKKIAKERITIDHFSNTRAQHWQSLSQFDIGLDTYPYNGTTTTCDLLNLGIPVVTCSGNSHVSRTTGSILKTLGMESWIASDQEEFVAICQEKAANIHQLKKLRQSLKTRFSNSTLGHSALFMVEYEQMLLNIWKQYCDTQVA